MTTTSQSPTDLLTQVRKVLDDFGLESVTELASLSRRTLIDCGTRIGLTGLSRLTKSAIVEQFLEALQRLAGFAGIETPQARQQSDGPDTVHKFDLGRLPERDRQVEHIPWSYGQDRVTAIVIDPERLYVYWEVTDDAIDRARAGLGPGGRESWLNLRVYDVTGRLFDGTNAHGYTDTRVERSDRQWFFSIGRPASEACVELGMRSTEGYFVKIARSGRVEFPRLTAVFRPEPLEWLTVRTATGEPGAPVAGPTPDHAEPASPVPEPPATLIERVRAQLADGGAQLAWGDPEVRTRWEHEVAGNGIASPVYVEERWGGAGWVEKVDGQTRIVYGPWEVVIRGIDAHAERRVIGVWELVCTIEGDGVTLPDGAVRPAGASEWNAGASERRIGGASERWRIGASELRFRGASEMLYGGASERRLGGSERSVPPPPER
jgi:hypothetical protein